jgi:hypothetical protein
MVFPVGCKRNCDSSQERKIVFGSKVTSNKKSEFILRIHHFPINIPEFSLWQMLCYKINENTEIIG